MKTRHYCCDDNRDLYEDYYAEQCGSGMPVYQGSRGQRGHGLGSILSGLFRSAWPILRNAGKSFGKRALQTGLNIANDVVEGSTFRDAASRRVPEGIKGFAESNYGQTGSGKRRKHTPQKIPIKRCKKDIFDL